MSNSLGRVSIFVDLTDEVIKMALTEGSKRHYAKDSSFRDSNIYMSVDDGNVARPHQVGIIGEIGYSQFSGVDYDRNIYDVKDDGIDFGKVAEVKTVTYTGPDPELKIKTHEFHDPERKPKKYILARYDKRSPKRVELVGEISREDFDKHKTRKRYRGQKHENYVVGLEHLSTVTPISKG